MCTLLTNQLTFSINFPIAKASFGADFHVKLLDQDFVAYYDIPASIFGIIR